MEQYIVLLNSGTTYYTSYDTMAWTTRTFPATFSAPYSKNINGVLWVCLNNSGTLYKSTDGITWTTETL